MSRSKTNPPGTATLALRFAALAAILAAWIVYSPTSSRADAAPLRAMPAVSLSVPAGSTAYIHVKAITLQHDRAVSGEPHTLAIPPLAPELVRTTLYYAVNWGYDATDPQQAALAVWWSQDNTWYSEDRAIAERIASAAANSPGTPGWNPGGSSLLPLVSQGHLVLGELHLTPDPRFAFTGSGTLAVHNTSTQDYLIYLPYGTVFTSSSGSVLVWATAADSRQGTPTLDPASTAQALTPTATVTTAPTDTATSEPVTHTPTYKQGLTPTAEPSATASYKAPPGTPTATHTATPAPENATPPQPSDTPTLEGDGHGNGSADTPAQSSEAPQTQTKDAQHNAPQQPEEPSAKEGAGDQSGATTRAMPDQRATQGNAAPPMPTMPRSVPTGQAASAPPPVNTAGARQVPSPVSTSRATPANTGIPAPQSTANTGIPVPQSTANATIPRPVATGLAGQPSPTSAVKEEPMQSTPPPLPTSLAGTSEKTPEPTPVPPPTNGKEADTPVIIVRPEVPQEGAAPNNPPGSGNLGGAPPQNPPVAPPMSTPTTGGGPSMLPMWLTALSLMLVLGGWVLRRLAASQRKAEAAPHK